jgi:D-lactate dehydrogenase (cytochrome)
MSGEQSGNKPVFTPFNQNHLDELKTMVAPERISTGQSVIDLHSKDQSHHPAGRPEAVIWPVDKTEVSRILAMANQNRIPVTCWGAGTSLEGNPIPTHRGLVLDFSRMNRILSIRAEDFQADLEPGVIYQDLNEKLRHKGLFFPPDPGARATIGGMIANNASGTKTVRYGATKDHVLRLCVALPTGEIIELGTRASKTSSGYDLLHLFVGSEGTLGVVVEATVRLTGVSEEFSAAMVTFPTVQDASKAVYEIIRSGLGPAALELLGPECVALINQEKDLGLDISPTLMMEFHGPSANHLAEVMEMVEAVCREAKSRDFRPGLDRGTRDRLLKARHELGEMIIRNHPGLGVLSIDVAVPITGYSKIIAAAREEAEDKGLTGYTFSHAGDGNVHFVLVGKKEDPKEWSLIEKTADRMVTEALSLGGTATGEHGVGLGKRKFMNREHGSSLVWMKEVKRLFDPVGILNPGKVFPD